METIFLANGQIEEIILGEKKNCISSSSYKTELKPLLKNQGMHWIMGQLYCCIVSNLYWLFH